MARWASPKLWTSFSSLGNEGKALSDKNRGRVPVHGDLDEPVDHILPLWQEPGCGLSEVFELNGLDITMVYG